MSKISPIFQWFPQKTVKSFKIIWKITLHFQNLYESFQIFSCTRSKLRNILRKLARNCKFISEISLKFSTFFSKIPQNCHKKHFHNKTFKILNFLWNSLKFSNILWKIAQIFKDLLKIYQYLLKILSNYSHNIFQRSFQFLKFFLKHRSNLRNLHQKPSELSQFFLKLSQIINFLWSIGHMLS